MCGYLNFDSLSVIYLINVVQVVQQWLQLQLQLVTIAFQNNTFKYIHCTI